MIELLVNEELVELSEDFQILINKSIADIRNPEIGQAIGVKL